LYAAFESVLPRGWFRNRSRLPPCQRQHVEPMAGAHGLACAQVSRTGRRLVRRGQESCVAIGSSGVASRRGRTAAAGFRSCRRAIDAGRPFIRCGIALIAALSQPRRIQALALYEPTLFGLLDAESPPPNEADGIRGAVASAAAAVEAGDLAGAAEYFVDFWMGRGAWARTPESRKGPIAQSMVNVRGWADALFNEPTPLAALSQLKVPVLYMMGSKSPSSSRGVGRLLIRALPKVQVVEFNGMGHMGPVTHPGAVNTRIARFLDQRGR